jgi:two-component system cell cycle sensor histidine kinase/response regulator CckA
VETILIVEDEASVRTLCASVMEQLGYQVLVAGGGLEALEKCRQYPARIDLLLTDVVMPGMDGRELASRIVGLRPNIKTLFCSGYTGEAVVHSGALIEQDVFLQKPYTPRGLAKAVRTILSE